MDLLVGLVLALPPIPERRQRCRRRPPRFLADTNPSLVANASPTSARSWSGRLRWTEVLDVTVVLRRRRESQSLPGPSHWLTPPSRRPRLSAEEFARRYGAAEEDIGAIRAFAQDQSLEVRNVSAARRTVTLSSTVGHFNRDFGVNLNLYQREAAGGRARRQQPAETYRGREGFIYVPEGLVDIIIGVFGLDNLSVTHINAADPPNTDPVPLADITRLYRFPPNQAIGQTIAIFSKGGYLSSDISANFQGNPPLVTDVPVNAVNRKFADPETTQDIVISAAVAPGADVAVYFNDGSERGWVRRSGGWYIPTWGTRCARCSHAVFTS